MEHIGETLGIPSETVKQKNMYEKGQVHIMWHVAVYLFQIPYLQLTPSFIELKYCNIREMWTG